MSPEGWGVAADALSAEAGLRGAELEEGLERAARSLEAARAALEPWAGRDDPLEGALLRARRLEEVARAEAAAALRVDLLGLNVEVEAARLGEDEAGLEAVGREIRALADRGARAADEVARLAREQADGAATARESWLRASTGLARAHEQLGRAQRAAEEVGAALAEARGVTALAAAATAARARTSAEGDVAPPAEGAEGFAAAALLAASAEARDAALNRLARAVARRLDEAAAALRAEARASAEVAARIERLGDALARTGEQVARTDVVARRSKELAVNADLAASRSGDPAFALFAEEARRLAALAEGAAGEALDGSLVARDALGDLVGLARERGAVLERLAHDLGGLLARFARPDGGEASEGGLARAWRDARVAARHLAAARARWRAIAAAAGAALDADGLPTARAGSSPPGPEDA